MSSWQVLQVSAPTYSDVVVCVALAGFACGPAQAPAASQHNADIIPSTFKVRDCTTPVFWLTACEPPSFIGSTLLLPQRDAPFVTTTFSATSFAAFPHVS